MVGLPHTPPPVTPMRSVSTGTGRFHTPAGRDPPTCVHASPRDDSRFAATVAITSDALGRGDETNGELFAPLEATAGCELRRYPSVTRGVVRQAALHCRARSCGKRSSIVGTGEPLLHRQCDGAPSPGSQVKAIVPAAATGRPGLALLAVARLRAARLVRAESSHGGERDRVAPYVRERKSGGP